MYVHGLDIFLWQTHYLAGPSRQGGKILLIVIELSDDRTIIAIPIVYTVKMRCN